MLEYLDDSKAGLELCQRVADDLKDEYLAAAEELREMGLKISVLEEDAGALAEVDRVFAERWLEAAGFKEVSYERRGESAGYWLRALVGKWR